MSNFRKEYHKEKELVEDIMDKVSDKLTTDEIFLIEDAPRANYDVKCLKEVEILYYQAKYLPAMERAIAAASISTSVNSIEIKPNEGGSFELHVSPTRLGFLSNVFVFFGKEIGKLDN